MRVRLDLASVMIGIAFPTISLAHVTLAVREAPIAADYKAVFRVPHGCKGSATIKLSVEIPDGMVAVKPQPKPGWQIEIVKGPYNKPYQYYHSEVTAGVKSVSWSGGHLPDDYYDEFVLIGYLDKDLQPGSRLYFPTVQTCEQGFTRFVDVPSDGMSSGTRQSPAPSVTLLPSADNAH